MRQSGLQFITKFISCALTVLVIALLPSSAAAQDSPEVTQRLAELPNSTSMSYNSSHGTQIEYLASNGRTYLWYPGNQGIVRGRYKIEDRSYRVDTTPNSPTVNISAICFKYGSNSFNPVTGVQGGNWQCLPFFIYDRQLEGSRSGDVFRLANRRAVPFVLSKQQYSFSSLLSACPDC